MLRHPTHQLLPQRSRRAQRRGNLRLRRRLGFSDKRVHCFHLAPSLIAISLECCVVDSTQLFQHIYIVILSEIWRALCAKRSRKPALSVAEVELHLLPELSGAACPGSPQTGFCLWGGGPEPPQIRGPQRAIVAHWGAGTGLCPQGGGPDFLAWEWRNLMPVSAGPTVSALL